MDHSRPYERRENHYLLDTHGRSHSRRRRVLRRRAGYHERERALVHCKGLARAEIEGAARMI